MDCCIGKGNLVYFKKLSAVADLVQQHLYVMRTAWELESESLFRSPPNFLIWLLAKKIKNKIQKFGFVRI